MVLSAHGGWRQQPVHKERKKEDILFINFERGERLKTDSTLLSWKSDMKLMKMPDNCFSGFIIPRALPKARAKARIHKICNLALTFGRVQQVPICV